MTGNKATVKEMIDVLRAYDTLKAENDDMLKSEFLETFNARAKSGNPLVPDPHNRLTRYPLIQPRLTKFFTFAKV
jgi:hypothetical protein